MIKEIYVYNGRYVINEYGKITNYQGHILSPAISNSGYLRVCLQLPDGTRKNESIHRLVAQTFIPNPDNLPVVMHLDNDKLNNHVSNLQWGTQSENISQAFNEGRKVSPLKGTGKKRLTCSIRHFKRYELYNNKDEKVICESVAEAAELVGYTEKTITNIARDHSIISQGPFEGYKIRRIR